MNSYGRRVVNVSGVSIGYGKQIVLIAGPCVIENEEVTIRIAKSLKSITQKHGVPFIFKASYDKANRTSIRSFRGPGLKRGLEILKEIRSSLEIPVLSDVHRFEEIEPASEVLDVLQIPAFLCRQTDLIVEVARTGKPINIKKGQFMAPHDIIHVIEKAASTGNESIMVTERGYCFGYNNLVTDIRALPVMRSFGYPVIYDATHSAQRPGGMGSSSGGEREMVPYLARAAVAAGIDGLFLEVHEDPEKALSDGPNSFPLQRLSELLELIIKIDSIVKKGERDG